MGFQRKKNFIPFWKVFFKIKPFLKNPPFNLLFLKNVLSRKKKKNLFFRFKMFLLKNMSFSSSFFPENKVYLKKKKTLFFLKKKKNINVFFSMLEFLLKKMIKENFWMSKED